MAETNISPYSFLNLTARTSPFLKYGLRFTLALGTLIGLRFFSVAV